MYSYNIFVKQNRRTRSLDDVILVKEGFNLYAMIFNLFWFITNKLYLFSVIFFVLSTFAFAVFSTEIASAFILLLNILIGFEANNLLLYKFQRENYFFVGYSTGKNKKDAELRFLDEINKDAEKKHQVIY